MQKPVLFLDFDYTLFDTAQIYDWLGDPVEERIAAIEEGVLELPELGRMLYSDTISFLIAARKTHRSVLLTCTIHPIFQKKKVENSGVVTYLDDVLVTEGVRGNSGKAVAAQEYLHKLGGTKDGHVFVDDTLENISEMKTLQPNIRSIEIKRSGRRPDRSIPEGLLPPDATVTNLTELRALL